MLKLHNYIRHHTVVICRPLAMNVDALDVHITTPVATAAIIARVTVKNHVNNRPGIPGNKIAMKLQNL